MGRTKENKRKHFFLFLGFYFPMVSETILLSSNWHVMQEKDRAGFICFVQRYRFSANSVNVLKKVNDGQYHYSVLSLYI